MTPTEIAPLVLAANRDRHEDAPLLALADALGRAGDADLAELLRLEVELGRPPLPPGRWREAFGRRLELIRGRLRGMLGKMKFRVELPELTLDRGFLTATCYDNDLIGDGDAGMGNLSHEPVWPHVARLTVSHRSDKSGDEVVRQLLDNPVLGHVSGLSLSLQSMTVAGARLLAGSPRLAGLRSLALACGDTGPGVLAVLLGSSHLAGLREFSFAGPADALRAVAASPHLAGVRSLTVWPDRAGGDDWAAFGASPHLAGVRSLTIASDAFDADAMRGLAGSPLAGRLESLTLPATANPDAVAAVLADAAWPALQELSFRGHPMTRPKRPTSAALVALAGSRGLAGLRALDMPGSEVDGEGVKALAKSPVLAGLRRLTLTGQSVGAAAAKALAKSPHLGSLTDLRLGGCKLGAGGVEALLTAPSLGRLEVLNLTANAAEDSAVRAVLASERLAGLRVLGLGFNKVTDAGVEALAAASHLGELGVLDLSGQGTKDPVLGRPGKLLTDACLRAASASELFRRLAVLGLGVNAAVVPAAARLAEAFGGRVEPYRRADVMHLFA